MTASPDAKIELFPPSEFEDRIRRVKASMQRQGIDLLLVASPANHFWLTGYDGWSFYTPQMVLLHMDEDEPIWFGRKMDSVGARFTAFMGAPTSTSPAREPPDAVPRQDRARARLGVGARRRRDGRHYYTAAGIRS